MHESASHSDQGEVGHVKEEEGEDSGNGGEEGASQAKPSAKEAEKIHGSGGRDAYVGKKPEESWRGEK